MSPLETLSVDSVGCVFVVFSIPLAPPILTPHPLWDSPRLHLILGCGTPHLFPSGSAHPASMVNCRLEGLWLAWCPNPSLETLLSYRGWRVQALYSPSLGVFVSVVFVVYGVCIVLDFYLTPEMPLISSPLSHYSLTLLTLHLTPPVPILIHPQSTLGISFL